MRKVYYIYNPKTQTYDRTYPTLKQRVISIVRRGLIEIGVAVAAFVAFIVIFGTPSEKELRIENSRLRTQYNLLSERLDEAMGVLQDIQQRDDNLYRVMLGADPIPNTIRRAGYAGTNRYAELMNLADADLVVRNTQKMDMLDKQLYIQSVSFDEVMAMCRNHENMLQAIPAIQPVNNKDLRRTASGYGWRIDPIYNDRRFHSGMDFSAPLGTEVYATGNGTVIKAGWESTYGNIVEIDHGFGYVTTYAHLRRFYVKKGQKVMRGQVIAEVGNTGKSTGPHLHYEIWIKGKHVNPINYYFMDLDAESYDRMIQLAANNGKMLD
ncbi:MAG: M23 family metallopeptidase [Prevotellaceae bacterium]|jgi:murein DD-endopeptidase MepM/ murein hydrolase activator NlpD|nr:M23 family metallopeptidase [Prevotellaceae bacterium]